MNVSTRGQNTTVAEKVKEANELASLVANLYRDPSTNVIELLENTYSDWVKEDQAFVLCEDGPPDVNNLLTISGDQVFADSALVSKFGFDAVMQSKTDALCFLGSFKGELAVLWEAYPDLKKLLDLMELG